MNLSPLLLLQASTDLRETFRLLDLPETWVVVLVVLPVLALVAWLGYRGERIANGGRWVLATLRFLALAILMGCSGSSDSAPATTAPPETTAAPVTTVVEKAELAQS